MSPRSSFGAQVLSILNGVGVVQTVFVLPLSALLELAGTVGPDACSRVGDAVATHWGSSVGDARWIRSSANHVFIDATNGLYFRFVPVGGTNVSARRRTAELTIRLANSGLDVAPAVPATSGDLVVVVDTDIGPMCATAVRQITGRQMEVDELDAEHALGWGHALGRMHEPRFGDDDQPEAFTGRDRLRTLTLIEPEVATAIEVISDELDELPRGPSTFGVVHGDFELDNITWNGDRPVAYDFDGAGRCWFMADIVFATRDLTGGTGVPEARYDDAFSAFLHGYRRARPGFDDDELSRAALFARMHAANSLAALRDVIDVDVTAEAPDWLAALRKKITTHLTTQRALLLDTT